MNFYVGTSGYAYKEWKGSFYPDDLPAAEMLTYYGERFRAVEINNTYYRVPKTSVVESWTAEVPPEFKFVLKASQRITHMRRLKDVEEPLSYMLRATSALKDRMGPVLFQLPSNMKKDAARLRDFLAQVPTHYRAALEFRHASWFDDEVFAILRDNRAALCIVEAEEGLETPFVATAEWGYLRLRNEEYTKPELKAWAKRVQEQDWQDAFVFFKHEDAGKGPALAKKFLELVG